MSPAAGGGTTPAPPPRWSQALNPPIYLVSVLPGLGVPLLAGVPVAQPLALTLGTLAVVLLQHAVNLFNDAADWRLGADVEKYDSWVRVHAGRPEIAGLHGSLSLVGGGLLGLVLLWQLDRWWLLLIAVPMMLLGLAYNAGPRPLSYTHLGEWVTGLCYGPGVFGCLWLLAGLAPGPAMVAGMLAFAALAVALLLSHQPPQIETDRRAGKHTFAVRYGAPATRRTARALFLVSGAALAAPLFMAGVWPAAAVVVTAVIGSALWFRSRPPGPPRILSAASLVIGLGLCVRLLPMPS